MVSGPHDRGSQPPAKRRKKPSADPESAASSWETTRFFEQPKPAALPTVQMNGVIDRGSDSKVPTLKAPSGTARPVAASLMHRGRRELSSRTAKPASASAFAMTKANGDKKPTSAIARSKSLSRLRPAGAGGPSTSTGTTSQMKRKRSSLNVASASAADSEAREKDKDMDKSKDKEKGTVRAKERQPKATVSGGAQKLPRSKSAAAIKRTVTPAMMERTKSHIASLATKIMGDPNDNVSKLSELRQIAMQNRGRLASLTILTEAQIYRDIAPGYRVRAITEKEASVKVSKEVAKLRTYEQQLLSCFRRFTKSCISLSQWRAAGNLQTVAARDMAEVRVSACKALCTIISYLPHFNETEPISAAVIALTGDHDPNVRTLASSALTEVLSNAHKSTGVASETCVTIAKGLAALAEGRKARLVSEETLAPLSEINFSAFSRLPIGKQAKAKPGRSMAKLSKRKREMLAKKNRHQKKDEERLAEEERAGVDVDQDMAEAEADATPQELVTLRRSLLDAVCTACFNVIKTASGDVLHDESKGKEIERNRPGQPPKKTRKPPQALSAALRGLLRVARYVGPDVIDAVVAALVPLLQRGPYPLSMRLRCATAAYEIVGCRNITAASAETKNPNSKLGKSDPTVFETDASALDNSLFAMLSSLCGKLDVRVLDEERVFLDILEAMCAATSTRKLPAVRAAALSRRLCILSAAAATTHGCAVGLLKSAQTIFDPTITTPIGLLVSAAIGSKGGKEAGSGSEQRLQPSFADLGVIDEFDLGCDNADSSNATRSIAWELTALHAHFHPTVRDLAAQCIMGTCGNRLPKASQADNPVVVARQHCSDEGGFNPLPQETLQSDGSASTGLNPFDVYTDPVVVESVPSEAAREKLVEFAQLSSLSPDVDETFSDGEGYVDWCDGYFARVFDKSENDEKAYSWS